MGTPVDGPSFWGWVFEVARTREANIYAGILMLETKCVARPAHFAQESSSTANSMPHLTSRAGSCAALRNVEFAMKLKSQSGSSRRLRPPRRIAVTSSIRAGAALALGTGYGAQSATLNWSRTKNWVGRCASILVSSRSSRGALIRGAACSLESSKV